MISKGMLKEEWTAEWYDIILNLLHYIQDHPVDCPDFISDWDVGHLSETLEEHASVHSTIVVKGFYPGTKIQIALTQRQHCLVNLLAGYAVYGKALSPKWEMNRNVFGRYSRKIWNNDVEYHKKRGNKL